MKAKNFALMIAAAGNSTRMGEHKAHMLFLNVPALYISLHNVRSIWVSQRFVTLPLSLLLDPTFRAGLATFAAIPCANHFPKLGYFGSIKTVIQSCGKHYDGILILPVDSPIFSADLVFNMLTIAKHSSHKPLIIVPYFYRRPGHPIFISQHFFNDIGKKESGTLRDVIAENNQYIYRLLWADERILLNINTPQDIRLAKTIF